MSRGSEHSGGFRLPFQSVIATHASAGRRVGRLRISLPAILKAGNVELFFSCETLAGNAIEHPCTSSNRGVSLHLRSPPL